ncbi:MAG: hypothetical protein WKF54_10410 [Nocardioidaceae bacterium]
MTAVVAADKSPTAAHTGTLLLSDRADVAARLDDIVRSQRGSESPGGRRLALLTKVARAVLVDELLEALRALLDDDLTDLLVASWSRYQALVAAGRETSTTPGAESMVRLAGHTVRVEQHPDLELRVDGVRVVTLHVALDVRYVVVEAFARVREGRLVEVRAGSPEVEAVLSVDGVEVSRKSTRLEMIAVLELGVGISLVPERPTV